MKQLLLAPALLLATICFGQHLTLPYDSVAGRINYKQVTELASSSQDRVFSNALRWIEGKYKPLIDTVLLIDKASGQIMVKATLSEALILPGSNQEAYLEHYVTIQVKGNKCLLQISDLKFREYVNATEFSNAGWQEVPVEGIVVGLMNDRFTGQNAKAYKKFLVAENMTIWSVMQSFDQFLRQSDDLNASAPEEE